MEAEHLDPPAENPRPAEGAADQPNQLDNVHHAEVLRSFAEAQLATQHYIAIRVGLEGTYAAGLQVLFGAIVIVIGTGAYLFFPNVPFTGRVIAEWVVQPGTLIAILGSIFWVLLPRERRPHIHGETSTGLGTTLPQPEMTRAEIASMLYEASSVLAQREDGLRKTVLWSGGWMWVSLVAVFFMLHFEPSWLDSLENLRSLF